MHTFAPNTKAKSQEVNDNFDDLASGDGDSQGNSLAYYRSFILPSNSVITGCTTPSSSANLSFTMAGGQVLVSGKLVTVPTQVITVNASKDTYIDVTDDGVLHNVEVASGATSGMTMTTNTDGSPACRIMIIRSNASAITAVYDHRIGNVTGTILAHPTLSGWAWSGFDPLGNPVHKMAASRKVFRLFRSANKTNSSSTTDAAFGGYSGSYTINTVPGQAYTIKLFEPGLLVGTATGYLRLQAAVDGATLGRAYVVASTIPYHFNGEWHFVATATTHTITMLISATAASGTITETATTPTNETMPCLSVEID